MQEVSYEAPSESEILEYARLTNMLYDRYTLGETCVHYWIGQSRTIVSYNDIRQYLKEDE